MKASFALRSLGSLYRPHQTRRCLSGPSLLPVSSHDRGICDTGDAKISFRRYTGAFIFMGESGAGVSSSQVCRRSLTPQQHTSAHPFPGQQNRAVSSDRVSVHYFKSNSCVCVCVFSPSGESIPLVSVLRSENFPSHLITQTHQPRNISNRHLYFTKHFVFNVF